MGKVKYDSLLGKPVRHVHDPLYLKDADGNQWVLTINTDGSLQTTPAGVPEVGSPYGPLLWLTYAE